jgi:dephospho-CoA kinase
MNIEINDKMPQLVGFVGLAGAGKSTVTEFLRENGYSVVYFGDVVLNEIDRRGLVRNHENEKIVREDLRVLEGMDVMAKRSVAGIKTLLEAGNKVVIDGIYSLAEVEIFRKEIATQMITIAIHTPMALRYKRAALRGNRSLSKIELDNRDIAELSALDKARPIVLADEHVVNDGDLEKLKIAIFEILARKSEI